MSLRGSTDSRSGSSSLSGSGVRRTGGFSLLEVIVAMTIFATGVLGIITAFGQAVRVSSAGLREMDAVRVAERLLLEATRVSDGALNDFGDEEAGVRWTVAYQRPAEGLAQVDVTVFWKAGDREEELVLRELFRPLDSGAPDGGGGP